MRRYDHIFREYPSLSAMPIPLIKFFKFQTSRRILNFKWPPSSNVIFVFIALVIILFRQNDFRENCCEVNVLFYLVIVSKNRLLQLGGVIVRNPTIFHVVVKVKGDSLKFIGRWLLIDYPIINSKFGLCLMLCFFLFLFSLLSYSTCSLRSEIQITLV